VPYIRGLGAEETVGSPVALEILARVEQRQDELLKGQKRAEVRWRWQTIAAVAGAVFAAVRLGIIAVPHVKRFRAPGGLADPVENPRRRSHRRRRR